MEDNLNYTNMDKEQIIKEHYQEMAKLSHVKSPRGDEHYRKMQRKSVLARKKKKAILKAQKSFPQL